MIRFRCGSSDGGDYGEAREGCEEICCAAELGRARAVGSLDSERKESGATAFEGADFVEGGCFASWRGVERQPDRGGAGDQRLDGLPGAQAVGGGGPRGGVEPQAASDAGGCADLRRREGSQVDCARLFQAAAGTRALDLAVAGEESGGARDCRARQRLDDRSCFKKNTLKPHRREQRVIPPKANSAFVAAMEDVLAVTTRPRDPDRPLVASTRAQSNSSPRRGCRSR